MNKIRQIWDTILSISILSILIFWILFLTAMSSSLYLVKRAWNLALTLAIVAIIWLILALAAPVRLWYKWKKQKSKQLK